MLTCLEQLPPTQPIRMYSRNVEDWATRCHEGCVRQKSWQRLWLVLSGQTLNTSVYILRLGIEEGRNSSSTTTRKMNIILLIWQNCSFAATTENPSASDDGLGESLSPPGRYIISYAYMWIVNRFIANRCINNARIWIHLYICPASTYL